MKIKILGMGCTKCKKLEKNARKAVEELGLKAEIEKVEDMQDIMAYNIMQTPALVIDEEVKASGKVLSAAEIKELLK